MNAKISIVLALAIAVSSSAALARPAEDPREVQGRKLFAKGDYEAALEVYANLLAEKGDPIYQRNIGRCHQKLEQPEKAINAFREYLRRGQVKRAERAEVEGFIQEMEELQKRRAVVTPPPPPPATTEPVRPVVPPQEKPAAPPPPPAAPALTATPPVSDNAPGTVLTREASTPESAEQTSITGRWWFWTGLAVLVAGGAATVFALTYTRPGTKPDCTPTGTYCP